MKTIQKISSITLNEEQVATLADLYDDICDFITFVRNRSCEISTEDLEKKRDVLFCILYYEDYEDRDDE